MGNSLGEFGAVSERCFVGTFLDVQALARIYRTKGVSIPLRELRISWAAITHLGSDDSVEAASVRHNETP